MKRISAMAPQSGSALRRMLSAFHSVITAICVSGSAFGQGFTNLDFEQAIIQPINPESDFPIVEWELAAPGWSHSDGHDTQIVYYNNTHLGVTQAYTLIDSLAPFYWAPPFEGEYSLLFRNGSFSTASGGPGWVNAFVAQTGMIPADTLSIRLLITGIFAVFINGVEIPMVNLGGITYGGDISGFAGTVNELKILNAARPIIGEVSLEVKVDGIQFSPEAIPEPSVLVLLSLGTGLILTRILQGRRLKR